MASNKSSPHAGSSDTSALQRARCCHATAGDDAKQKRALWHHSRCKSVQALAPGLQALGLSSDKSQECDNDANEGCSSADVLCLTLAKPLGLTLDGEGEEEAAACSLDDEHHGTAHELSKETQEKLAGRKIMSMSHEGVSDLLLAEAAELVVEAESAAATELSIVKRLDFSSHGTLKLLLAKPLGVILDADNEGQAIALSLGNERPGAAHELHEEAQKKLVGKRAVRVNKEGASDLPLKDVGKQVVASSSPIKPEFEAALGEGDGTLRLAASKPFGFTLDADVKGKAIELSLND